MNSRLVIAVTLASVLGGWWLPSLWLTVPEKKLRRIVPVASAPESGWKDLQAQLRSVRSPMAMFQAVATGVRERGAGLAFQMADRGDFPCGEAEELARKLAGEELGSHVTDVPAFLKSLRESADYRVAVSALETWAAAHPDAALAALLTPEGGGAPGAEAILKRLAARDPDKMLALLQAAPGSHTMNDAWRSVLAVCAEKGSDFALAAIQSAPAAVRREGMTFLLRSLAAKDPRAALAWCEALPPELRTLTNARDIYDTWAKTDPAAAFMAALKTRDFMSGAYGSSLTAAWARQDPEAVLAWATAQPEGAQKSNSILAAVDQLASRDMARALAITGSLPTGLRQEAIGRLASIQAGKDAPAALAWARSLAGEVRATALSRLGGYADTLPEEDRRALAHEMGVTTDDGLCLLMSVDLAEATKVFAGLPVERQLETWENLSSDPASKSPADLAKLLETVILATPVPVAGAAERKHVRELSARVANLTSNWAGRDPAAAAAWVGQLPAGESQTTAAENLVLAWGRHDLPAAQAWVEQLPPGPARDKAGEQLAELVKSSGGG